MKPKIVLVRDMKLYEDQKKRLESLGDVVYNVENPSSSEEWFKRVKDADIICSGIFGMNSEKVYELNDVYVSLPVVGIDYLDIKRLKENNISVSNSPGCNKEVVTEWIIGMLLMKFRRLDEINRVKDKPKDEILKSGTSLYGKNITILGHGNIGKVVGKICEAI